MTTHWSKSLEPLRLRGNPPCVEALKWARTQPDPATAWATCTRGDWMLWILGALGAYPRQTRRLGYQCAERARQSALRALRAVPAPSPELLAATERLAACKPIRDARTALAAGAADELAAIADLVREAIPRPPMPK